MDNSNQLAIEIGARLRTWRRSLGMTQEDMAVRLQVNPSTYKRYELGLNAPGAPVLHEACGLGVNTNWLLYGTPPMVRMAKSSGCDSTDSVLEELCCSLNNLRLLDPEKYAILTRGFVARSAEAAACLDSAGHPDNGFGQPGKGADRACGRSCWQAAGAAIQSMAGGVLA